MASTTTTMDVETGIRVTVSPAQSSFFAGETFAVTVTFTNTHSVSSSSSSTGGASSSTAKRTPSQTHKRAAHSVSTAALARPPTSPRTPQTAFAVMGGSGLSGSTIAGSAMTGLKRNGSKSGRVKGRRGLIGIELGGGTEGAGSGSGGPVGLSGGKGNVRRKLLAKSMSVSIPSEELGLVGLSTVDKSVAHPHAVARDPNLPLNPSHPHARKISVLDGQTQVQVQLQDITSSPSSVASPFPGSASASTSAFSLALDTISEGVPTHGSGDTETHSYPPRPSSSAQRASTYSGLGQGPPPLPVHDFSQHQPPKSAFASTFASPNTELVLYSYAQLVGTLTLGQGAAEGVQLDPRTREGAALNSVRAVLARRRRQAVGGGSMEIKASLDMGAEAARASIAGSRSRRAHSRAASLSSSIFSLLSPSSSSSTSGSPAIPWTPTRKMSSPSIISSLLSSSVSSPAALASPANGQAQEHGQQASGLGLGLQYNGMEDEFIDPATPLPTFDVQPAMLAVDLSLAPGESRSYVYTLPLPANLPPTYKGRMLKFTYHLVVGVCRAAPTPSLGSGYAGYGPPGAGRGASTSRVMRVPIRMYNAVVESGVLRPYDLLWPAKQTGQKGQAGKVVETKFEYKLGRPGTGTLFEPQSPSSRRRDPDAQLEALASLQRHAIRLLSSLPSQTPADQLSPQPLSASISSPPTTSPPLPSRDITAQGQGELTGCREAVEILTRNMRKVSYDVNKDGVKVAVLTFMKSAYRLGETVVGVVELNERWNRAKVLKITALLEAHESLPSSLAPKSTSSSTPKKMRKVHAEHHSSLIPATLRTTFTLDIPSDAAPAFQCTCDSGPPGSPGGLEWKVRLCLLVAVASEHAREGYDRLRVKHLIRDGPRGEWGSSWRPTRGIAPLQNIDRRKAAAAARSAPSTGQAPPSTPRGWAAYFISSVLTPGEREYHDGDEEPEEDEDDEVEGYGYGVAVDEYGEVDIGGGEKGWEEMRVETVECEVPVKVWPGNTAFRPLEVGFEL